MQMSGCALKQRMDTSCSWEGTPTWPTLGCGAATFFCDVILTGSSRLFLVIGFDGLPGGYSGVGRLLIHKSLPLYHGTGPPCFGRAQVCTPERPTALTATVSDRPTPSRRFSSVRRSSAASRAPSRRAARMLLGAPGLTTRNKNATVFMCFCSPFFSPLPPSLLGEMWPPVN